MLMSDLKLSPASVAATGIESGDYFATDVGGFAMIYRCRTLAHGVLFDDREEPMPFRTNECYTVLQSEDSTITRQQHQCVLDRNKALGIKGDNKGYVEVKSEELVAKYSKKKRV